MNDKLSQLTTRAEIDEDLLVVDYVADRMNDEEKAGFEARLREDEALMTRVAEEREFRSAVVGSGSAPAPDATAFDKLRGELGDEPVKRASPWRRGAIAAVLVAAAAVVVFMDAPQQPVDPGFGTLSSDDTAPATGSRQVRIVFAESVSDDERLEAAGELGFTIVGGPAPSGAYVVESQRAMTRDELLIWRDDPRIDLAEPIRYRPQQ